MEAKVEQLVWFKSCIINFGSNTRKTAKNKKTKGYFQARQTLLDQYWNKYVAAFEDIMANRAGVSEEAAKGVLTMEDFSCVELAYSEASGDISDEINKVENPMQSSSTNESRHEQSVIVAQNQSAQLPRIAIPVFDGKYMHWNSFKDLFTSLVIKNTALTNTQRLQYLKDALRDEAKHALDNIITTDANFAVALNILEGKE